VVEQMAFPQVDPGKQVEQEQEVVVQREREVAAAADVEDPGMSGAAAAGNRPVDRGLARGAERRGTRIVARTAFARIVVRERSGHWRRQDKCNEQQRGAMHHGVLLQLVSASAANLALY
jgi:hypothetical protein